MKWRIRKYAQNPVYRWIVWPPVAAEFSGICFETWRAAADYAFRHAYEA